jgi:hypothetical protein
MKRLAAVVASSIALTPSMARAQIRWGPPIEQPSNVVAAGIGTVVGVIGVRYARFLAPSPFSVWAGAGALGGAAGLELTLPRIAFGDVSRSPIGDVEAYLSAGLLQDWGRGSPRPGSLVIETGIRRWVSARSGYVDFAIGGRREIWGTSQPGAALALRALVGVAF